MDVNPGLQESSSKQSDPNYWHSERLRRLQDGKTLGVSFLTGLLGWLVFAFVFVDLVPLTYLLTACLVVGVGLIVVGALWYRNAIGFARESATFVNAISSEKERQESTWLYSVWVNPYSPVSLSPIILLCLCAGFLILTKGHSAFISMPRVAKVCREEQDRLVREVDRFAAGLAMMPGDIQDGTGKVRDDLARVWMHGKAESARLLLKECEFQMAITESSKENASSIVFGEVHSFLNNCISSQLASGMDTYDKVREWGQACLDDWKRRKRSL